MSTHIQWTDETWNPLAGCRKASPGCDNCYAMGSAHRMGGNPDPKTRGAYIGLTEIRNGRVNWNGETRERRDHLEDPLHWRKPRRIFVNSMSDLFYEPVAEAFIDEVFGVMERANWHVYQVLTKRAQRMAEYTRRRYADRPMPSHIWLGVSAEDQQRADERLPHLCATPAAVRFVSAEPLLGSVSLAPWLSRSAGGSVNWVILGGESGHRSRDCDSEWLRVLMEECQALSVACFVKQLGSNLARSLGLKHPKGGEEQEWPAVFRVRQFPIAVTQ